MRAAVAFGLVALAACTGVDADPGTGALVQVSGAQFYPGAMPAPTTTVAVTGIDSTNNTVVAGQTGKGLAGRVQHDGRAVAIGFDGDVGYWIVPVGAADLNMPDELTWSAKVAFSKALTEGPHPLEVAAVDADGGFGPPRALDLTVRSRRLDLAGTKLAVSLTWDTEADLDLHLVLPTQPPIIVWAGNPNSYEPPPPGEPANPDAAAAGGILDFDSNSQCGIDGRREENIAWRGDLASPPSGTYAVLIDTFSLCAAPAAHWAVDVFRDGAAAPIAHAEGTTIDADTRGDHVAGSGVRALTFEY